METYGSINTAYVACSVNSTANTGKLWVYNVDSHHSSINDTLVLDGTDGFSIGKDFPNLLVVANHDDPVGTVPYLLLYGLGMHTNDQSEGTANYPLVKVLSNIENFY